MAMVRDAAGHKYSFSIADETDAYLDSRSNQLIVLETPFSRAKIFRCSASHNVGTLWRQRWR